MSRLLADLSSHLPFIDSHCHLDRLKLESCGGSLPAALQAARAAGVGRFLCIGIGPGNVEKVLAIAGEHSDVYAALGIHPSEFAEAEYNEAPLSPAETDAMFVQLEGLTADPRVAAIGETGLDFYHEGHGVEAVKSAQQESFRRHLTLARSASLPVVVHTRQAREETLAAIRAVDSPSAGVLHCFTEDWDMASRALDMGYYISLSGIVTFRSADNVREVAKKLPVDRLLLETDSPWLAPVPHRGKPNQPAFVADVYHCVASLRNESVEQLTDTVWHNFHRLFPRIAPSWPVP